jgi:putative ABC transport system substrate-binding protein
LNFHREHTKLGVVWDNNPAMTLAVQDTEVAARTMSVSVHAMVARSQDELDKAFADLTGVPVHAPEVMPTPVALRERRHLAELALKYRLPTAFAQREYVEAGGLMSYGSNFGQIFRRATIYVDKVLKGARPAELPIEQATTFELVINLRTARALGLAVPPSLQARADHPRRITG